MEEEMHRAKFKAICVVVSCLITSLLCGCNLFVTDKDKFYLDKDLDYMLTWIDLEKTGSDIIIPSKVGDKTVKEISLKDPYFSGIDSLDVSHVEKLQSFNLELFIDKKRSKLKKLDFSKKLRFLVISKTNALEKILFNSDCESILIDGSDIKSVNLRPLEKLIEKNIMKLFMRITMIMVRNVKYMTWI